MSAKYDITIDKNSDYKTTFELFTTYDENNQDNNVPMNIDGYEASMIFDNCSINANCIVSYNKITVEIPYAETKDIRERYLEYNLVISKENERKRLFYGEAHLTKGINCDS